ncbi:MAG: AI-2E family transporter [Paracoccaceae bacterium]
MERAAPATSGDEPGLPQDRHIGPLPPLNSGGTIVLAALAVVAALHFGRDVFLPLAIAILIAFALSPPVAFVRKTGVPTIAAVLVVVTLAFSAIGLFGLVVAGQVGQLSQQLPLFQDNIVAKLGALQETGPANGLIARVTRMVAAINAEIASSLPRAGTASAAAGPITVEVVDRRGVFRMMTDIAVLLISPIAMVGVVIVLVVFMLIQRDDLRDRFIQLVGANDINRTTQLIEDAGTRVGTYLLIQLLTNVIYAIPIGAGLWLIGVPNAVLWGMVTLVVRFVPYVGPLIAAIFPLLLAFAVSPGWSTVLWTAALFMAVELVTSNVIEPWFYGSRTGVNPLAIIVSAIFWTWVWGPMGLVLSTPLTVCLVVMGRYLPQFAVFDVLFGDRPVLAPHSRLYQRLLVGDTVESTSHAGEILEEESIADYHRDIGIPALLLAQTDLERGRLSLDQETRFADAAEHFLLELDSVVAEERQAAQSVPDLPETPAEQATGRGAMLGNGYRLALLGGRTRLDDLAARMLGQAATAAGADVVVLVHSDLSPTRFAAIASTAANCVILSFLDVAPSRASLLHIRRLKRSAPEMRVGLVLWQLIADAPDVGLSRRASEQKLAEVMEIGADFCATSIDEALGFAFRDVPAVPATATLKKSRKRKPG